MLITILLLAALMCFLLDASRAETRVNLTALGLACLTGALLVTNGVLL